MSLKARLLVLVVVAAGAAQAIITGFALWQETNRYAGAKRDVFLSDAHVLAAAVAQAIARNDRSAVFQTLRAIGDIKGLIEVSIRDGQGRVLNELGASERLQGDLAIDDSSETISIAALLTTRSIAISVPIVHAGVKVGTLQVTGDASDLASRLVATVLAALAGLSLSVLAGGLIAWRMQGSIARPLRDLTAAMQRVGVSHDYTLALPPSAVSEVGILIGGFNTMLSEIRDRDGRIAESYAHLEEQVAERTLDLQEAKEAAETANLQKSDFLATMSHEIRTPMNGMLVMAEMLANAGLPPRARRHADVIARSGQSLLAIINDILDFSKIEAGKLELESVAVDLAETAGTVMDLFHEKARGQGLDLAARVAVDLPRSIHGDPVRLNQILGNFINNALKFTETGGVRLDVERDPLAPERIRFSVTDTGIGIAAGKIETIFGAFSQADQSTTRRYGGTGLGLAICRKLVAAMGAEITVTSEPGAGSVFAFSLSVDGAGPVEAWPRNEAGKRPRAIVCVAGLFTRQAAVYYLEEAGYDAREAETGDLPDLLEGAALALVEIEDCTPAIVAAAAERGCRLASLAAPGDAEQDAAAGSAVLVRPLSSRDMKDLLSAAIGGRTFTARAPQGQSNALPRYVGARALVADDNAVNREVAAEALKLLGFTIDLAEDGAEAVTAFQTKSYDIIFMDGSMPVLDGFAATRQIRTLEQTAERRPVPIIALTAHVIGTSSTEWAAAGMNAVLHKPFTLKALSRCIAECLSPGTVSGTAAEAPVPVPETVPDQTAGTPIIDGKTLKELQGFAAAGRQDFVLRVTGLFRDHAPKAVDEIAACAHAGNGETAAKAAHALKSMSLNIGASRVAGCASDMETKAKQQILPSAAIIDELGRLVAEACEHLADIASGRDASPSAPLTDHRARMRDRRAPVRAARYFG